tara:strand:+ start:464 stop:1060 length:597 start_codon:yes stop_codon:yes gene_type:complete
MNEIYSILDFLKIIVEENYYLSIFLFFIFLTVYNALSVPGSIIFMASTGYFLGIYIGFLISLLSIVLGSLIFFLVSKFFLKKIFPKIYFKYSNKITKYISNSSFEYLIIFRMIPGPPLMLQNFCLSVLNINIYKFILSSIIGFSPIVFITTYFGNKLNSVEKLKEIKISQILSLDFLIFLALLFILLLLRIIYKNKKN